MAALRAMGLVTEWTAIHRAELLTLWEQAKDLKPLRHVDPLP